VSKAKPFDIPKTQVWEAYKRVKANRGAAGVDGVSLETFEKDLKSNLYKIWNRMSSGSYFPPPVRRVEINKEGGGKRGLGIPTVADRIAQMVAKQYLEPIVEPVFHADSYGYRPGKSAHDALATTRKRCWRSDWVIDLDIRGFFDHLDWDLAMRAVRHHTDEAWVLLYIERWLKVPMATDDGGMLERTAGTPQGGVISPLLANLFLHHAFDAWMMRTYPHVEFERYADDIVVHCASEREAKAILAAIAERLSECRLELHPKKTKIVYCKDDNRRGTSEHVTFDFLGYTFRPRLVRARQGKFFVSFAPAISEKSAMKIRAKMKSWSVLWAQGDWWLESLARRANPSLRAWLHYFGRFHRSKCARVLGHFHHVAVKWACRNCKRFRGRAWRALRWLELVARRAPDLVVLWRQGIRPRGWAARAV
jgi:RNA-directed DNA polymerase